MANGQGFKPFGNVPEVLQGIVQQQSDPQQGLINARLAQVQEQQQRTQLLNDFFANTDLSILSPSDIIKNVMAITGNTQLVGTFASSLLQESQAKQKLSLFEKQQEALKAVGERLEASLTPESEGGREFTESEEARDIAFAIGSGQIEAAKVIKSTGIDITAKRKAQKELSDLVTGKKDISPPEKRQRLSLLIGIEKAMRGVADDPLAKLLSEKFGFPIAAGSKLDIPGLKLRDIQNRISELTQSVLGVEGKTSDIEIEILNLMKDLDSKL